jgi:hypothetical protein
MKTLEFYAYNDATGRHFLPAVHDTVAVVIRENGKLTAFRLDMPAAERALADLNAAILKAQGHE